MTATSNNAINTLNISNTLNSTSNTISSSSTPSRSDRNLDLNKSFERDRNLDLNRSETVPVHGHSHNTSHGNLASNSIPQRNSANKWQAELMQFRASIQTQFNEFQTQIETYNETNTAQYENLYKRVEQLELQMKNTKNKEQDILMQKLKIDMQSVKETVNNNTIHILSISNTYSFQSNALC
jgi:hypothetical protein